MASMGHGISDAVRNHIPIWVDNQVVNQMYDVYKQTGGTLNKEGINGFRSLVTRSDGWVRKGRSKTTSGWERKYHCKTVQTVTLVVHSPDTDMSANAYVFR